MHPLYLFCLLIFAFINGQDVEIDREKKLRQAQHFLALGKKATAGKLRESINLFGEVAKGGGRLAGDALAQLAYIYTFRESHFNIAKALQYANQSAALRSPRGMHIYAFYLRYGAYGTMKNEVLAYEYDKLAAENNYMQAQMTLGWMHYVEMKNASKYEDIEMNCRISLSHYQTAASNAINLIRRYYHDDFLSLRRAQDSDKLGDTVHSSVAREKETLEYYVYEAGHNDGKALFELGRIYQFGINGVQRNMRQALRYFEDAASVGFIAAKAELGRILTVGGHEIDIDLPRGLVLLRDAADAGDASAMATLGILIRKGLFKGSHDMMSVRYLKDAAQLGNAEAQYELGQLDLLDGKIDSALQYFRSAEQQGHIKASYSLGNLYAQGIGVLKSCGKAILYYKSVCESGFWVDDGVKEARRQFSDKNYHLAYLQSLLAANEGYSVGQFNAAWLILRNKVNPSPKPKYELALQLLASHNFQVLDKSALLLTGDIYRSPSHRNSTQAAMYYSQAAEKGSAVAISKLAVLYQNGAGVVQDDEKASILLRRALRGLFSELQGTRLAGMCVEIAYRYAQMSAFGLLRKTLRGAWITRKPTSGLLEAPIAEDTNITQKAENSTAILAADDIDL